MINTKVRIGYTGGESGIRTHGTAVKAVHSISSRAPSTGLSHLSYKHLKYKNLLYSGFFDPIKHLPIFWDHLKKLFKFITNILSAVSIILYIFFHSTSSYFTYSTIIKFLNTCGHTPFTVYIFRVNIT